MPKKLDRKRIAEQVHQQIVLRTIPAGALIDESEIAEGLLVSRTPIRETVHWLAGRGLLKHEPGIGYRTPVFGMREVRDFFAAARVVYPEVFALAGAMRRSTDLEALDLHLDRIASLTARGRIGERMLAYRGFTVTLARAARNGVFDHMMDKLIDLHLMMRVDFIHSGTMEDHDRDIATNLEIYRALRDMMVAGDVEALREAAVERLEVSRAFVFRQLSEAGV